MKKIYKCAFCSNKVQLNTSLKLSDRRRLQLRGWQEVGGNLICPKCLREGKHG